MPILTKAPRGTGDVLPGESSKIRFVESTMLETAECFGFKEIRTPGFEHTELFNRSVGDTTDIVQKEMYTFNDKGGRSVTLKPEGTAGAVRAFIEHGLFNEQMPVKLSYVTPAYRYEKPQSGRLREFHQFGVECFGAATPAADAEVISLGKQIFDFFGVKDLRLEINSIGCPECRKKYQDALKSYFSEKEDKLCGTCKGRLNRNPMRILDCKSPICSEIASHAPVILDYLCDECREHFELVQKYLNAMEIEFTVNPSIVRGLDYYTRTVFEFVTGSLGAQSAVCAGGRYDGLTEELGGNPTPACGFALGIERFMLLLQAENIELPPENPIDLYIASMSPEGNILAAKLASDIRNEGVTCLFDTVNRSLKAQMKFAGKTGALFTVVLGDDEIKAGKAKVKYMADGSETEIGLDDFAENFMQISIGKAVAEFDGGNDFDLSSFLGNM
ncbi:MAG: histidine--tRNA ligase [Clostridiales bacterium]|nr:histidine--tRNA ligase [Clostridiales bacterium]